MSAYSWYKRFPSDFLNGIAGMGPDVIGCYSVVLDMIYDRGGPVANDPRLIGGILGCSPRMARSLIANLLGRGKLFETPSGLSNMRAEITMAELRKEGRKHRENGAKGGRKSAETRRGSWFINDLGQAPLKHRARVRSHKKEKGLPEGSTLLTAESLEIGQALLSSPIITNHTRGH